MVHVLSSLMWQSQQGVNSESLEISGFSKAITDPLSPVPQRSRGQTIIWA